MNDVAEPEVQNLASRIREDLAVYQDAKDLIDIGAYVNGSNPKIDQALKYIDKINEFLCQRIDEKFEYEQMVQMMTNIYQEVE